MERNKWGGHDCDLGAQAHWFPADLVDTGPGSKPLVASSGLELGHHSDFGDRDLRVHLSLGTLFPVTSPSEFFRLRGSWEAKGLLETVRAHRGKWAKPCVIQGYSQDSCPAAASLVHAILALSLKALGLGSYLFWELLCSRVSSGM